MSVVVKDHYYGAKRGKTFHRRHWSTGKHSTYCRENCTPINFSVNVFFLCPVDYKLFPRQLKVCCHFSDSRLAEGRNERSLRFDCLKLLLDCLFIGASALASLSYWKVKCPPPNFSSMFKLFQRGNPGIKISSTGEQVVVSRRWSWERSAIGTGDAPAEKVRLMGKSEGRGGWRGRGGGYCW